jgi:copper homeostasis protein (lipoprotein)
MKSDAKAFGIGMMAWTVGIVAIITFVLLLAFIPKYLIAPDEILAPSLAQDEQTASGTLRFIGVLPCADCEGIRTELELRPNGTFTIEETYLGKIATQPRFQIGNWATLRGTAWDLKATVYKINHDRLTGFRYFYLLADGNIKQLDEKQAQIQSSLNHTLERQ